MIDVLEALVAMLEHQIVGGKYRLTGPLAKGGMGSVWVAEHVNLGMRVAVKFMDPKLAQVVNLRGRFEREAKAVAQLRSPNVIDIHDYGLEGDTPYIVMELLKGEDLSARLKREGKLVLAEALPIMIQLCKALRCAHEEGIIHRDLKPANIFLAEHQDEILVKVLDFGIAKLLRADLATDATTEPGTTLGSPQYMSPEQVRGIREIDHRTDLWSLGVIMYRILTDQLPFPGSQMGEIFLKICTAKPLAPSVVCAEVDPRVDWIIAKALAVDPSDRFQSANEMLNALNDLVGTNTAVSFARSAAVISPALIDIEHEPVDATTNPYQRTKAPSQDSAAHSHAKPAESVEDPPLPPSMIPSMGETPTDAPVTQPARHTADDAGGDDTADVIAGWHRRKKWAAVALGTLSGFVLLAAFVAITAKTPPTFGFPTSTATATLPMQSSAQTPLAPADTTTPKDLQMPPSATPRPIAPTASGRSSTVSPTAHATKPIANPATARTATTDTPSAARPDPPPPQPTASATNSSKSKRFGF